MNMLQIQDIAKTVSDVAPNYPIKEIELFGSHARGLATDSSDIDLMLYTDNTFSLFDAVGFKEAVEVIIGTSVEIVSGNYITNQTFAHAIDRDKVLIYERES